MQTSLTTAQGIMVHHMDLAPHTLNVHTCKLIHSHVHLCKLSADIVAHCICTCY